MVKLMYIQILIFGKAVILPNSVFEDFRYIRIPDRRT